MVLKQSQRFWLLILFAKLKVQRLKTVMKMFILRPISLDQAKSMIRKNMLFRLENLIENKNYMHLNGYYQDENKNIIIVESEKY